MRLIMNTYLIASYFELNPKRPNDRFGFKYVFAFTTCL